MQRSDLEVFLAQGLSLAQIGERVGRHPSTVGYWIKRHGLRAIGRERHAPKGPIDRAALASLLSDEVPLREIARRLDRSLATVRHWICAYGLENERLRMRRLQPQDRPASVERICRVHGRATYVRDARGHYRCTACRARAVSAWRMKVSAALIAEAGAACTLCGYDRFAGALHFHHVDPGTKGFTIRSGSVRSERAMREEASKCVLLCANCHAEVEGGLAEIPVGSVPGRVYPA